MSSRSHRRFTLSFLAVPLLVLGAFAKSDNSVTLGTAGSYAVLAGSTVTNTGSSVLTGNLGVSAGCAVTGFPPGTSAEPSTRVMDPPRRRNVISPKRTTPRWA